MQVPFSMVVYVFNVTITTMVPPQYWTPWKNGRGCCQGCLNSILGVPNPPSVGNITGFTLDRCSHIPSSNDLQWHLLIIGVQVAVRVCSVVFSSGSPTYIYIFMHLADAFIQSDLQCIQAIHFCQYVCSLGIEPTTYCATNTILYHWATGTWQDDHNKLDATTITLLFYNFAVKDIQSATDQCHHAFHFIRFCSYAC